MTLLLVGLGLTVGSFLNVLIWRLNDDKAPQWWQGRSVCPRCQEPIAWFDNVPLLSFILLAGKCRRCGQKISWQYPVVEVVTAVVFGAFGLLGGFGVRELVLACVFIVIFFSDLIYGLIPDEMIVAGTVVGIIGGLRNFGAAVGSAAALFLVVLATRFRGLGLGDVKLAFLMGLLLGWPRIAVGFWVAFVAGGIVATGLLLLRRVKFSDRLALGPYLVLGTVVSALWSNAILAILLLR